MLAGQITYSTKLESSLNSISTIGKQVSSSFGFLATITETSFLIFTFCSIKHSRSGRFLMSSKVLTIFTPFPSYPNFALFQTEGNSKYPLFKSEINSLLFW